MPSATRQGREKKQEVTTDIETSWGRKRSHQRGIGTFPIFL
ncbi:hypothetical protein ISN45_At03g018570 [Arabidopsis thaliana x Arabidopsis arenosa]|uniref:Uncharacterized protein n=2 Tax=Arabidopsis TaxID=3701 RepID=A0A8T2FAI8_ARASU|nr:hypothetical protein ISN45_At03g018570 [Arabidopsis thaliana x Arabidopsis arenosa]KAG7631640.1 hypothetical protein ISN44_As03g018520 [Arabidopsis suecica]